MADDDRDTDRRTRAPAGIAWGSGSTPTEAARARSRWPTSTPPVPRTVQTGSAASATPSIAPASPGRAEATGGAEAPVPMVDGRPDDGRSVNAERDDHLPSDVPGAAAVLPLPDHGADATAPDQGDPGLPSGGPGHGPDVPSGWVRARDRAVRVLRSARTRPWVAGGLAAASWSGLRHRTRHRHRAPGSPSSPSVTPTAGPVTLEQLLDAPQTYADQLPGSFEAPVRLHSTRLIFTNRSLSGDDSADALERVGRRRHGPGDDLPRRHGDRIEASTAPASRAQDALHGSVSMSAQSLSGTLTLELSGGGVQGRVAQSF